jgi:hypothetical protein
MPNIIPIAAALGLIVAPVFPLQSASASGPQKVCSRPAPPRGPVGPGFNGPGLVPGVQGPGQQGPEVQNQNGQNQNGQNQNGQNQNGQNQNGQNQNGQNQNGQNQNNNNQNQNNQNANQNQQQNQTTQNQNQTQQTQQTQTQQAQQTQNQQAQQTQTQQTQTQQTQTQQTQQTQTQQTQNQQQAAQPVAIPVGSRVTLPGNFGKQPGMVYLVIGDVKLPMLPESWDESGITLTLPNVQITSAQQVKIEIAPANNGQVASLDITLNPIPKVIVLDRPVVVPTQTAEVAPDAPEPRS